MEQDYDQQVGQDLLPTVLTSSVPPGFYLDRDVAGGIDTFGKVVHMMIATLSRVMRVYRSLYIVLFASGTANSYFELKFSAAPLLKVVGLRYSEVADYTAAPIAHDTLKAAVMNFGEALGGESAAAANGGGAGGGAADRGDAKQSKIDDKSFPKQYAKVHAQFVRALQQDYEEIDLGEIIACAEEQSQASYF